MRQMRVQIGDDCIQAGDVLLGGPVVVMAAVVGADQHNGDLGMHAVNFAMIDAPEHMLGFVAGEA